jgi:hypothetical protein
MKIVLQRGAFMPISLRLPAEIETQIASYSEREGVSKSALIVRSIKEFLAKHAQPSAYEIYLDEMQHAPTDAGVDAQRESAETRPTKLAVRAELRARHARRSSGKAP